MLDNNQERPLDMVRRMISNERRRELSEYQRRAQLESRIERKLKTRRTEDMIILSSIKTSRTSEPRLYGTLMRRKNDISRELDGYFGIEKTQK